MKLAFGATKQHGFVIEGQGTVYTGDISEVDGVITWDPATPVLDVLCKQWNWRFPVRMVNDGTNDITLLLNMFQNDWGWCMNRWDGSSNIITRIGPLDSGGWNYRPDHQPFDVGGNGLVVVMYMDSMPDSPYTLLGYKIMVSHDYGATFDAPIDIDGLLAILGETIYRGQDPDVNQYAVEIDPVTGTAYILVTVDADLGWINFQTYLFKSTDGVTWELVKDFGIDSWYDYYTRLAVNGGIISASWNRYNYDTYDYVLQKINHSSDGGINWSVSGDIPDSLFPNRDRPVVITGNGTLLYLNFDYSSGVDKLYRSIDGGANWSLVLTINANATPSSDPELRAMDGIVAVTYDYAILPDAAGTWTDASGAHSMNVGGTVQQALWVSIDDGLTWVIQTSPHDIDSEYQSLALLAPSLVPPVPDPIVMPQVDFTIKTMLYVDRVTIDPNTGCIPRPTGCKPLSDMTMNARPASSLSQDQIPESSMSKDNAPVSALICEIKQ